jgi:hypothetical protein
LKKGNSSITKYFHKFTKLVDTLAAINKPLFNVELTSFLLGGFGNDFNSFVTSITTWVDPLKIEEIYGHLLAYEQRMEINQPSVDISIGSANSAVKRGFPGGDRFHYSHSSGRGFPTNTSYGEISEAWGLEEAPPIRSTPPNQFARSVISLAMRPLIAIITLTTLFHMI